MTQHTDYTDRKGNRMSDKSSAIEWMMDYWHFIIALVTGAAGLWLGAERTKWKVSQLFNDLEKTTIRQQHTDDRLRQIENSVARIEAGREQHDRAVLTALTDIKEQLHDKVDK